LIDLLKHDSDADEKDVRHKVEQKIKDNRAKEEKFVFDKSNTGLLQALEKYKAKK